MARVTLLALLVAGAPSSAAGFGLDAGGSIISLETEVLPVPGDVDFVPRMIPIEWEDRDDLDLGLGDNLRIGRGLLCVQISDAGDSGGVLTGDGDGYVQVSYCATNGINRDSYREADGRDRRGLRDGTGQGILAGADSNLDRANGGINPDSSSYGNRRGADRRGLREAPAPATWSPNTGDSGGVEDAGLML